MEILHLGIGSWTKSEPQVPYDCLLHVERWKSHWSNEKKRWCCEHSEEGQVACGAEEHRSTASSFCSWICRLDLICKCLRFLTSWDDGNGTECHVTHAELVASADPIDIDMINHPSLFR